MINQSVIIGRLTKDPELRYTPNGKAVASFTVASKRAYKDDQGNNPTDFINCVQWGPQAEFIANKARKGKLVGVKGRLESRSYDGQDGKKVFVTEINCDEFQLLEWDDNGQQGSYNQQQPGGYGQQQGSYNQQQGPYGNQGQGYNQQGGNNRGYSSGAPGGQQSAPNGQGQYNGGNNQQSSQRGPQDSPYNYMGNNQQQGQQYGQQPGQGKYNQQQGPNNGQWQQRAEGPPNNDPFANTGKPIDISDDDLPF